MKNLIRNNWEEVYRSISAAVTFTLVLLCLTTTVQATEKDKSESVEIKYVGHVQGSPVFQINVDNKNGETVYLAIRDENGNTIFADNVKDKSYFKKVQFEGMDLSDVKLTLTLRGKGSYEKQTFQINNSSRTIENVQVAKL